MKKILLTAATALLAATACAQNDSGVQSSSPGPQDSPAPNINAGGNPTAPAHQPSTFLGNPFAPTYPAGGSNMPAWRGGSVGDDEQKEDKSSPGIQRRERQHASDQRRAAEPNTSTHTGAPSGELASPNSAEDTNPGALDGGPQP